MSRAGFLARQLLLLRAGYVGDRAAGGGYCKFTAAQDGLGAKTAEHVAGRWPWIISGLKTLLETGEPLAG